MYEIYERLLKSKGVKSSDVSKTTGISNMTLSDWKNGKSTPKPDKLALIADYFDVSIDFLMGRTDTIKCEICGMNYNLLWDEDWENHERFHNTFLKIKEVYPFFMNYTDAYDTRNNSIDIIRNPQRSIGDRLDAFDNYLQASFSIEIANRSYNIEGLDYEQFCKVEVGSIETDWIITEEFIDLLTDKYGVDKNFLNGNEQILARISNNPQMMRILAYAEKLNPGMLDALEVQVKAWSDNNTKG